MSERILVVDDELPIRELVAAMLRAAGYEVTTAANGLNALQVLASSEPFNLMMSDLMMPVMDGNQLLRETAKRFPDMPVLMVTAVHDIGVALNSIRSGAYDYMLKPFDREQLIATVKRSVDHAKLRSEERRVGKECRSRWST